MLQVELNDIPDTYHYKEVLVADINEVLKECEELNCFIIPVRLRLGPFKFIIISTMYHRSLSMSPAFIKC